MTGERNPGLTSVQAYGKMGGMETNTPKPLTDEQLARVLGQMEHYEMEAWDDNLRIAVETHAEDVYAEAESEFDTSDGEDDRIWTALSDQVAEAQCIALARRLTSAQLRELLEHRCTACDRDLDLGHAPGCGNHDHPGEA